MRYKLIISYDGTSYCGWQRQPNGVSIQELIENALSTILRQPISIVGSGRTDAGVHAVGQTAHFDFEDPLADPQLAAINGCLPYDIRIKKVEKVPETFHARFSATGKEYHYHLWLEPVLDPFFRLYRHHVRHPLSLPLLEEAAKLFIGKKDFSTFANVGSSAKTSVRTIHRLDVVPQEGGARLEFAGDGFLYKMIRNITGTLIEVASGKRSLQDIYELFEKKDRRAAGIAAPAKGLFLMHVLYPSSFSEKTCLKGFSTNFKISSFSNDEETSTASAEV